MRVLYCTDSWPPQVNGVSVVTALSVAGLLERGWDVHVLAPRYPKDATGMTAPSAHGTVGLGITSLASVSLPGYSDIRLAVPDVGAVRDVVARFEPDLVHCATEFVLGRLGQVAARRAGVPIVTSYHTNFGHYAAAYGAPWLRGAVDRYLGRFHGRAARTLTPSLVARTQALQLGAREVEVWGCGVDTQLFSPARHSHALRRQLGVDDAFTVLHVGRLAPEKSVSVILDAFARARVIRPDLAMRLVVAGAGPAEAALRARAAPDTLWLGTLDRATDLPALYASADCFAFSSVTETLGLVVLEAMASGLPVIAVPAGGVAEHLLDNDNGLAFPAGDIEACARAIIRAASSREVQQRLRAGALRTAATHEWSRELDRLDTIYREVCAATPVKLTPLAARSAA